MIKGTIINNERHKLKLYKKNKIKIVFLSKKKGIFKNNMNLIITFQVNNCKQKNIFYLLELWNH